MNILGIILQKLMFTVVRLIQTLHVSLFVLTPNLSHVC